MGDTKQDNSRIDYLLNEFQQAVIKIQGAKADLMDIYMNSTPPSFVFTRDGIGKPDALSVNKFERVWAAYQKRIRELLFELLLECALPEYAWFDPRMKAEIERLIFEEKERRANDPEIQHTLAMFHEGFRQAIEGETHPISTLWDEFHKE